MTHTVGSVARMSGVTVRTLHHYDEIGLLSPSERSDGGYRIYGPADIARLQEILALRELGFGLDEISATLNDPRHDRLEALRAQRELLIKSRKRLDRIVQSVERAIEAEEEGTAMTAEDMLEVFGDFDPSQYEEEARERWGGTAAYEESERRTKSYTKEDWKTIGREAEEINHAFLALMQGGTPADSNEARAVVERHRNHITRWFYECSPEIHAGLGQMYVADPRFTENIDKAGEGLAAYMSEAIAAAYGG